MPMTKRDYNMVAGVLATQRQRTQRLAGGGYTREEALFIIAVIDNIAEELASHMTGTNPKFDRGRFLAAVGTKDPLQ